MVDTLNSSFTFWGNMKEAIEVYSDEKFKYKLYDALTEYALYGIWPEDDGTVESQSIISFVQSLVPSLDKSRNYYEKATENGTKGGKWQKVTDEQIRGAIVEATKELGKAPTRTDIVNKIGQMYGVKVDARTITRRVGDSERKEIVASVLLEGRNPQTFGF